ncbi:prepilin peptidase [Motilibacter deserti]|uniref:Prepilin leader peptidase/N-methyltransferase n=1 Tax=Motilibacter deserti TaxID=2714956 RepID=A0ABX0GWB1_9ACTN|nr:A24 family peptidase [Motilibacter deserti]NHC14010.1 prepilin peptidase [Motilibacter deserti]
MALLLLLAVAGLAVGSFLNVVVWRVPRGESVVTPASHCPSCGAAVRTRDNVPVLSWLLLRGRCRDCAAPISARYPLVEALTAVVFVVLGARLGASWELPAFLYLGAVGVALALIDLDVKRLPNAIVLPSYVVALVLLAVPALVDGRWPDYGRALLGMAILYGGYFALAFAYPAGMGFGDVKLAGVLGLYLGWLGWGPLAAGAFLGFLLGGVVGVVLLAGRQATRKTALPYGPFMLLGALIGVLAGSGLAGAYLEAIGA